MSWHELDYNPKTLEADTVQKVYENIVYIRQLFLDAGYAPSDLQVSNAQYSTPIAQVRAELQKIENDIDVINSVDTIASIYYDEHLTIGSRFTLAMYQRWLNILDDLKLCFEKNRRWAILRLSDCIPTINDEIIIIRGDEIGS